MVLDSYRKNVDSILEKIAKPFLIFKPNTLSWAAFVFAAFGGLFFYFGGLFLILSFLMILFNTLLDAVDGKVARMRLMTSRRGDFLDHLLDRYADTAIIAGIMFSAYTQPVWGLLALTGIYFTSYAGTHALAVTQKRDYGGLLGRADRLVLLIILPILQFFDIHIYSYSVTTIILIIIGVLGNITAVQRSYRTWRKI
jgi:archaetidylinositol phosphate synthase